MTEYCLELVQQGIISNFRLSFTIAGHTKFNANRLLSKIAISYDWSHIFNIDDLATVADMHAHVIIDEDGNTVRKWKEKLDKSSLNSLGVHMLHNFVNVKHILSGEVIMRVSEICYTGSFESSKMKAARGVSPTLDAIPKKAAHTKLHMGAMTCLQRKWKI